MVEPRHVRKKFNKHLKISESKAKILGSSDRHVREGSSVTFICKVNQGPHDLNTVYWFKDSKIVQPEENNEIQRIRIQVSLATLTLIQNFILHIHRTLGRTP